MPACIDVFWKPSVKRSRERPVVAQTIATRRQPERPLRGDVNRGRLMAFNDPTNLFRPSGGETNFRITGTGEISKKIGSDEACFVADSV